MEGEYEILQGDCTEVLKTLPDESVDVCVTSPPYYGLRTYHSGEGEIGREDTPLVYVERLRACFHEVRRVLKPTGTLWLNLGDSYNGDKAGNTETVKCKRLTEESSDLEKKAYSGLPVKSLLGMPWRTAFALQDDGWVLRSDIIWVKPNPMPCSVTDRCSSSHEYVFMFSKRPSGYYFDYEGIMEPAVKKRPRPKNLGREGFFADDTKDYLDFTHRDLKTLNDEKGQTPNTMHRLRAAGMPRPFYEMRRRRDVWEINVSTGLGVDHFATFPEALARLCVIAGCPRGGLVLDPFSGAGTTGVVALKNHRRYQGIELNPRYVALSNERIRRETSQQTLDLEDFTE